MDTNPGSTRGLMALKSTVRPADDMPFEGHEQFQHRYDPILDHNWPTALRHNVQTQSAIVGH